MSEITVIGDLHEITDDLKEIERQVVPTAMRQGLNRTATGARTDSRRLIAKQLNVPQKEIKDSLSIRKATRQRFYEASLTVGGGKRDLVRLGASRDLKVTKRRGATFKGKSLKGAFRLPGIKRGLFKRQRGNPRYSRTGNVKVVPLFHYTPAQQFTHKAQAKVALAVPPRMLKAFDAAMAHQLRRRGFR